MCGRRSLRARGEDLARLFGLADVPLLAERYNVAPTQPVPVVRQDDGTRTLALLRWGLVPSWAQPDKAGPINARSETADTLPTFRSAFRKRRCLIPADGFFEGVRSGTKHQPCYFRLSDGRPFAFAGLWECWHGEDGELLETCAILTAEANDVVRPVHPRMPVLLGHGDFGPWLDPAAKAGDLKPLLRPYAGRDLEAVPVSTFANNARSEGPRCLGPPAVGQTGLWDVTK